MFTIDAGSNIYANVVGKVLHNVSSHAFISNTFITPTGQSEGKFHTDATGLRCFICTFTNSSSTTTFTLPKA